jgi:transposase
MPGKRARVFSREFKEAAVLRILAGERVQALAAELHVWPKLLYDWWRKYDRGGAAALRGSGRPPRSAGDVVEPTAPLPPHAVRRRRRGRPRAVQDEDAVKRIVELKRKVGEQALEIDFFRRALRHVKAPPRPSSGRGGSASSRSSTR